MNQLLRACRQCGGDVRSDRFYAKRESEIHRGTVVTYKIVFCTGECWYQWWNHGGKDEWWNEAETFFGAINAGRRP